MERREDFLRENRPKEYRRLRKAGEVEAHLERSSARCVQRAESLIASGTHEAQAWSWAIRSVLLESLED